MSLVFMFPGQSSRYPGMLEKLAGLHPTNAELLQQASRELDWDLRAHFRADKPDCFARNVDVQVGVFVANHLFLNLLQQAGIEAELSLGLSLGEYNHLVHIGALDFRQALHTVRARGEAYDSGPRGWMASIQPIDLEELRAVVEKLQGEGHGLLEIVNLNSPRQHVISGAQAAVEEAVRILEDEHYVQAVIIERQVPMHSSLFSVVGTRFREHLNTVEFKTPQKPYLPNRCAEFFADPKQEDFVELLATHVHEPVYWRASVDYIRERNPEGVFVEVGPMSVLHNLLHRKWVRNSKYRMDSAKETEQHVASVIEELRSLQSVAAEVHCSAS